MCLIVFTLSSLDTDEAAGVGEIWRGVCGPVAWHKVGDEDHSSRVWRRRWRGVPQPPLQGGQDEEAAVAEAESLRGRPHGHGARRVAEKLPVVGHWRTVWGELEHAEAEENAAVCLVCCCNSCSWCPKTSLHLRLLLDSLWLHFIASFVVSWLIGSSSKL